MTVDFGRQRNLWIGLAACLTMATDSQAWLRPIVEDAEVAQRSELIVVAGLKSGSVKLVPHERKEGDGHSWEYHATLVIEEILKGESAEKEIPIVIHYGLSAIVDGIEKREGGFLNLRTRKGGKPYAKGIIEILDTGNSGQSFCPLVANAREPNLWFLRKRSGIYGREPGNGNYGIVDPEDLRPLEMKPVYLIYLNSDPEPEIRKWVALNPESENLQSAKRYLDHCEIQRILKIDDPSTRCDKLLPFFEKQARWGYRNEAKDGILACGNIAGKKLQAFFQETDQRQLRGEILLMWRDLNFPEITPFVVDLLEKHDEFWAKQGLELEDGWWNEMKNPATAERRARYTEVYYGVSALSQFNDPTTIPILETTLARWKQIKIDNNQIIEACERALEKLK